MTLLDNKKSIETENVENKLVANGILPSDIWETISAFSNADGGVIKLGVDNQGNSVGISPEFLDKLQTDILSLCNSGFNHKLYPDITVDEENNLINIYIPPVPASLRPIYTPSRDVLKGGRVRVGSANVQLDDEWVRRFAISANGGAELVVFPAKWNEYLEEVAINRYLDIVKRKRGNVYENLSIPEILIKLRAIAPQDYITMFGLLAFSNQSGLQELVSPTVNIAVTQYAGTNKVNPDDLEEVSVDDKEFSGNIVSQFENALKFIQSKLPVRSRIDQEGKRQNYLAIPHLAIREALANTLVHRDYTTVSSRVQIDIYVDRIEFANPGRSLVPLNLIETAHPQTRNPLLMNYLRDLNITEHRGRGIRTIKTSLKAAGLAEPSFEHRHDWFVATIYSSAFIKDDDQVWLQQFGKYQLNERQLNALVHVKHNQSGISNAEYRHINNMNNVRDDIRAKKELAKLTKLGLFEKVGENRYRRYVLSMNPTVS